MWVQFQRRGKAVLTASFTVPVKGSLLTDEIQGGGARG